MSAVGIPVWNSIAGGALIGAGAATLLLGSGRIAGISGITDRILIGDVGESGWRVAFIVGLVLPALVFGAGISQIQGSPQLLAIGGLLVGYGTRVASGCTSGHGVCGIANLSTRSLVATLVFITTAVATAWLHQLAGSVP